MKEYNLLIVEDSAEKQFFESIILDKKIYLHDTCVLDTPVADNYFCLIMPENTTRDTAEQILQEVQKELDKAMLTVQMTKLLKDIQDRFISEAEHITIYNMVKERDAKDTGKRISLEEIIQETKKE
jgi:hypothetical protein